ncbi:MAG: DUF433 domain-containing protein [Zavarzinella sp.]|nr:DUF433 domain-containing protein [Zavarzinella sp.]
MSLTIAPEAPPLTMDEHGRIRVAGTRVFLELVVSAHKRGLTPQQIAEQFDALTLADVYGAITYYLRHRPEVEAYLAEREARAQDVRERIEASQPPFPSKAELLARRRPPGSD